MTPDELAAIRARLAAATPGPWIWDESDLTWQTMHSYYGLNEQAEDGEPILLPTPIPAEPGGVRGDWALVGATPANAALIAHAPTDIRALLAEVARLQANEAEGPDTAPPRG